MKNLFKNRKDKVAGRDPKMKNHTKDNCGGSSDSIVNKYLNKKNEHIKIIKK